jgi:hypothetical protein
MAVIKLKPSEFGLWLDKTMHDAAKAAMLSTALRIVQIITTEIIPAEPRPPVDRGAFRAGWKAKAIEGGAEITNTMPYASIIEYGAKAENIKIGRKMIEALTEWVRRKGLAGPEPGDASRIAWAIAQSMAKRGIFNEGQGLHVLDKAMKNAQKIIDEEYARELKRRT